MSVECQHCGKQCPEPKYYISDQNYIVWCADCISENELILSNLGVSFEPLPGRSFQFKTPKNIALLKTIAPKFIKLSKVAAGDLVGPVYGPITISVIKSDFCKFKYYGIECDCPKCNKSVKAKIT